MPADAADISARLATHDARLTGLEQGVKDIVTAVSLLSNEIKEEGRRRAETNKPQWGVIFSGLGVMFAVLTALGGALYAPIMASQTELKAIVRDLDHAQVPRVEHEKIWAFQERFSTMYMKRLERLEEDLYRRGKS